MIQMNTLHHYLGLQWTKYIYNCNVPQRITKAHGCHCFFFVFFELLLNLERSQVSQGYNNDINNFQCLNNTNEIMKIYASLLSQLEGKIYQVIQVFEKKM